MPAIYRNLGRCDFDALLATYPGPALIFNGADDRLNRRGAAGGGGRAAPVQIIPNAGHLCNLQQPEAFTAAVRNVAHDTA